MSIFTFRITSATSLDVNYAIEDAHEAYVSGTWSQLSSVSRSNVLSKLARNLEKRIPELAEIESMQTGRAIREMKAQLSRLPEWL